MSAFLKKLHHIKTFVFDVDGVLTDGGVFITEEGQLLRTMNIKDGYALKHAVQQGYTIVVISGGRSKGVETRLRKLGIEHVFIGVDDKLATWEQLVQLGVINPEQTLCMGDDLPDLPIMTKATLPCCPADAVQEIRDVSLYASHIAGGKGCVRDVIEKVLKVQERW